MCKIEILLGSSDANRMLLIAGDLLVAQETDMALFTITEHHLVNTMYGVSMEIKFKRKIMSEMMTTYLPSVLLMLITFATTFFKPFFFEAALSVNLTTMLVMTTIFMSKMESLPPTSDIKMIDIRLIFCQLVPFAQVVLLTAMEYLRESEQEKKKKEKQGKRKRKREKKIKGKEREEEKQTQNSDNRQSFSSARDSIGGDLQLEVEREDEKEKIQSLEKGKSERIEQAKENVDEEPRPREAWTMPSVKDSRKNPVSILISIGKVLYEKRSLML